MYKKQRDSRGNRTNTHEMHTAAPGEADELIGGR